jgi:hypothetical protein
MFLFERLKDRDTIGFIKQMFFNNYSKYTGFLANFDTTSKAFNRTWPDIYGDFFTQSYYTGSRSSQGSFVHDAPLFQEWSPGSDTLADGYSIITVASGLGMKSFSLPREKTVNGGSLSFIGDSTSPANTPWSVHCILRSTGNDKDSVFTMPVGPSGIAKTSMAGWSRFEGAIVIVANARDGDHRVSIVVEPCPVSIHAGDSATVNGTLPAPLSSGSAEPRNRMFKRRMQFWLIPTPDAAAPG